MEIAGPAVYHGWQERHEARGLAVKHIHVGPRPTLISLFTGAGGLDIGLERAGFHTVAANDFDANCVNTLLHNQQRRIPCGSDSGTHHLDGTIVIPGPIQDIPASAFRPEGVGETWIPDALVGGPPCQPFSSAGSQRGVDDPRGRLFEEFVRVAAELRPRLILFENVRGLVTARGPQGRPGEALNLIRGEFERIGYATRFAVLNAADFGAPQRRVRLFMFGAAEGTALPEFPEPTHFRGPKGMLSLDGRLPWLTLGDFLATTEPPAPDEIARPSATLARQLADIEPGSGLKSPGRAEPTRPGGHWGYKQGTFIADPSLPARTVTGASTQDWIREADGSLRRITLREAAGLQGFPAQWEFLGSKASRFLQVGNAVPTRFGEVLGRAMIDALRSQAIGQHASAPFPAEMHAAIDYAARDDARNGSVRPRSPRFDLAAV